MVRAGFALDDLTGHVQYSDRDQDGYYFLSRTYSKTLSGNLKYALTASSDLSLGFEKSERFRDREGSVTGVNEALIDPRGLKGGRGFSRNFDVDLSRLNLTYSNDLDERSNLLAVVYQYQDDTTFWSSPMRFSATGAPTTGINDYSLNNDYQQVQRGFKTEYRTHRDRLALMGGLEVKRNTFDNRVTTLNSYRSRPTGPVTPAGMVMSDDDTVETTQALYGEAKLGLSDKTAATFNLRHDRLGVRFNALPVAGNGNRTVAERKDFDVNSYRLGLTHALDKDTALHAAVSTGFRAPTAEQLYRGQTTTNALVQGNPDLQPEKATSFEIGLKRQMQIAGWPSSLNAALFQVDRKDFILDSNGQYAGSNNPAGGGSQFRNIGGARSRGMELGVRGRMERLNLDVVGFYNRYSNLIEDARLIERTPLKQVFQTVNITRAKIYGFEVKGIYDWGQVGSSTDGRLRSSFSYGQTRGKDVTSNSPLNSVSPAQLSVGLRYDTPHWGVYANARHYAAKRDQDIDLVSIGNNKAGTTQFATPSATTLDVGMQWRPRSNVRLNLALNNLTNQKYWRWADVYGQAANSPTIDAYTQPGRNIKIALTADF